MPFFTEAYFDSLSKTELDKHCVTNTHLGYHPQTQDYFIIPDTDRFSGMYVLGVQGVRKSSLLERLIFQDIVKGYLVIAIHPPGDLEDRVIDQTREPRMEYETPTPT